MVYLKLLHVLHFRSSKEYIACEILAIPAKYDFQPYAYVFQKDSPYLSLFNFYLKKMAEKGTIHQLLKKYEPAPQQCPGMHS